jgi:DNA-binding transcriptional MerR regulator
MLAQLDLFASTESQSPEEKIKTRRLTPPAIIEVEAPAPKLEAAEPIIEAVAPALEALTPNLDAPTPKEEKKISVIRPAEERQQAVTIGGEKKQTQPEPYNKEIADQTNFLKEERKDQKETVNAAHTDQAEPITEVLTGHAEPIKKSTRGRKSIKEMELESARIDIPADDQLYSKQYYAIGEVATMFQVNASLLRYWESEFDLLKPRKNKKGDRFFRPDDIKHLKMIHHLLRERKYTIEGARAFLKKSGKRNEQFEAIESLRNIRAFLLELRAGL